MPFQFKRKESVDAGVQRIGQERIECAFEALQDSDPLEGIHRVRMEIKRVRSVLRLVRSGIDQKDFNRQARALREAAQHLAEARDAHVMVKALTELNTHFKEQLPTRPFSATKSYLQQRCREAMARYEHEDYNQRVIRILKRVQRDFRDLRLGAKGWQAVCPGVAWSYEHGRCCQALVLKNPDPETFHQWRKRVKDLWYHALLLRRIWPEQMCAMASELKTLSSCLGDDHDLVLLKQVLSNKAPDESEVEALNGLITQRQQELRSAALVLGARFYAEKPAAFSNRLGRYWRIWQPGRKKLKRAARVSVEL